MTYLKLCQLSNDNYIENCIGNIILNDIINYPLILKCEIIEWDSENDFNNRGKALSFISEEITLNTPVDNIRQTVFELLQIIYPELII